MAALRVCRALLKELKELRKLKELNGAQYRDSMSFRFLTEQMRKNQVTGEQYCRAQKEALHAAQTYLCLLSSTRHHMRLHNQYHARGERPPEEVAKLVGLRLPAQPGGKGWEK